MMKQPAQQLKLSNKLAKVRFVTPTLVAVLSYDSGVGREDSRLVDLSSLLRTAADEDYYNNEDESSSSTAASMMMADKTVDRTQLFGQFTASGGLDVAHVHGQQQPSSWLGVTSLDGQLHLKRFHHPLLHQQQRDTADMEEANNDDSISVALSTDDARLGCCSFASSAREIAVGGDNGDVHVVTLAESTWTKLRSFKPHGDSRVNNISYSCSSTSLAVAAGPYISVCDLRAPTASPSSSSSSSSSTALHLVNPSAHGAVVESVSVHAAEPKYILGGRVDGCIDLWDTRKPKFSLLTIPFHQPESAVPVGPATVWECKWAPRFRARALACSETGEVAVWDFGALGDTVTTAASTTSERILTTFLDNPSCSPINSVDIEPFNNDLVAVSDNGTIFFKRNAIPQPSFIPS